METLIVKSSTVNIQNALLLLRLLLKNQNRNWAFIYFPRPNFECFLFDLVQSNQQSPFSSCCYLPFSVKIFIFVVRPIPPYKKPHPPHDLLINLPKTHNEILHGFWFRFVLFSYLSLKAILICSLHACIYTTPSSNHISYPFWISLNFKLTLLHQTWD